MPAMKKTSVQTLGEGKLDISFFCPWCRLISRFVVGVHHRNEKDAFALVVCQVTECSRASLLILEDAAKRVDARNQTLTAIIHPEAASTYAPAGVGDRLARDVREAMNCFLAGYDYAAALVGRRVLQMAARDIVGTSLPNLMAEIDALPGDRVSNSLKDAAHQVRLIGNDAAHADEVTRDEVDHLIRFMLLLLNALYVLPAEVDALKAKRAKS